MIQEYITAYPQGVTLSEPQKQFNNTDSTVASHSILLELPRHITPAVLEQTINTIIAEQVVLGFAIKEVTGFRGDRQIPQIAPLLEVGQVEAPSTHMLSLVAVTALVPNSINTALGHNIQAVVLNHAQTPYLLLRVSAQIMDINSVTHFAQLLLQPELPRSEVVQYPDFQAWLQELSDSEEAQQGKAYWQQYHTNVAHSQQQFALPYRKVLEAVEQLSYQNSVTTLSAEVHASLCEIAQSFDIEIDVIYQATWWLLLARINDGGEFLTAFDYDPRMMSEELESALGVYQQNLPIVVPALEQQTLTEWVNECALLIEQHIEWAECYQADSQVVAPKVSSAVTSQPLHKEISPALNGQELQLTLHLSELETQVCLHYSSDAYSSQAAQIVVSQYQALLEKLPVLLALKVDAIELVTDPELLTYAELNKHTELLVPSLFEQLQGYAKTSAAEQALVDSNRALDYASLHEMVLKVATQLHKHGVDRGDIVTVSLPRSWQQVVILLAIMRSGAAYCPIDPAWPEARQTQIMNAANAKLFIGGPQAEYIAQDLILAAENSELSDSTQLPELLANDSAYVLFTSGSMGTPKGVIIEHGQLAQYCAASSQALNLQQQKRFGLTSTVAADIGNTCLFNAFYNGGCLAIADESQVLDGQAFGAFVQQYNIDCVKIVPSHLQALLEGEPKQLPDKLILGGEACAPTLLQKIHRLSPHTQVYNHYGPTEATVGVMSHYYPALNSFADTVPKLSHVFTGSAIYILNRHDQLCATGELGELFIAGKQLARGYLIPTENSPFKVGTKWAERLYATGDLARYMPDGSINLSGRKDDQIQIRGFRVEPNEVAASVANHLVDTGCYVAVQKVGNEPCLVAFLTGYQALSEHAQGLLLGDDNAHLQGKLREVLPDAMVPTFFVMLDKLPLLTNGKVDRHRLPEVAELSLAGYVGPETQLETLLANTLANILDVEQVSCDASFFDLGGHSLSAIKFVTRIKKLLLVEIEPGLVFDNPTVKSLAGALKFRSRDAVKLEMLAMTQLKIATLTPEQQVALKQKLGLTTP